MKKETVLTTIKKLKAGGLTDQQIATKLNQSGIKTPGYNKVFTGANVCLMRHAAAKTGARKTKKTATPHPYMEITTNAPLVGDNDATKAVLLVVPTHQLKTTLEALWK